jgi:hypothetical protein
MVWVILDTLSYDILFFKRRLKPMCDMFNLENFEIVPPPKDETPRQLLKRITGRDVPFLDEYSWDDVRKGGMLNIFTGVLHTSSYVPPIELKKIS